MDCVRETASWEQCAQGRSSNWGYVICSTVIVWGNNNWTILSSFGRSLRVSLYSAHKNVRWSFLRADVVVVGRCVVIMQNILNPCAHSLYKHLLGNKLDDL